MRRAFLASLAALAVSACAYTPDPLDLIHVVDDATDVRFCRRLAEVSPVVPTTPGFEGALESMLAQTVALGGTHLYLNKQTADWLLVRGIAYYCEGSAAVSRAVVVRAKG
ncbi:hypothetical protein [Microvirga roseola]|uniref:hypothetical protein n=1 Tax=Microvirga roseola TaxID=2883126 RepID=UPI001E4D1259|nr:hypothetical protein [Microvirga roseola]